MSKVFLDFGHGGSDNGASSGGLVEDSMTLVTGLECKNVLEDHGVFVKTSRESDVYVGLSERAAMANYWVADYFVSIHYNAGGGDGIEVIHSKWNGKGLELAKAIVNAVCKETGQNARPRPTYSKVGSDGKDYFAVIRETNMDAIIVECAFIDSVDRAIVDTIEEQKAMGKAIALGILNHLGISYTPSNNVSSSNKIEPEYYVETSYINQEAYANSIANFFNAKDIKFQLKHDSKGVFIQTMHMKLDKCKTIAYTFTGEEDIMAYVWREDKLTDQSGNISYTPRVLV